MDNVYKLEDFTFIDQKYLNGKVVKMIYVETEEASMLACQDIETNKIYMLQSHIKYETIKIED